jgi:hypothetical protein
MGHGAIRSLPCIKRGLLEERYHFEPPPQLKADQSGGSEIHFGPLICAPASEPQIYALYL